MVRRRVPERDVEDVVQSALTEALLATDRPTEPEAARRWLWAVTRNKIADYHRKARREHLDAAPEARSEAPISLPNDAERELLRWAVGELPEGADAQRTFEWLLREGDGEKLEAIAADAQLPAPAVRQRVSRMRRFFRERWAIQLAVLGLVALGLWALGRRGRLDRPRLVPEPPTLSAEARGRAMRQEALQACARQQWPQCVEGLDAARALDPQGDLRPEVTAARRDAARALAPERAPVPRNTVIPDAMVPEPAPMPEALPASPADSLRPSTGDSLGPLRAPARRPRLTPRDGGTSGP